MSVSIIWKEIISGQYPAFLNTYSSVLIELNRLGNSCSKVDNAIHRINLYPLDSATGFTTTCLLDRDLPGG